jgi:hypothetical protein
MPNESPELLAFPFRCRGLSRRLAVAEIVS